MISDERLEEVINGDILFTDEQREMAKELLAYRQGFVEPEAYVTSDGRMLIFADSPSMLPEDKSSLTPLYRNPTMPERGI